MAEVPLKSLERYDVLDRIAVGGMAEVFLAKAYGAHGFEKTLAIKRILPELARDPEFEDRFIAEAKVAVKLSHTNVVQVFDFGRFAGSLFIAMEYVDGQSLSDRLLSGPLPLEEVLRYGIDAADALTYAHDHSVVHRDFKAANAMVTTAGRLKIVDFGLARRGDDMITGATTVASIVPPGTAAGTPHAMAPEQVRGEAADARTDIWALGVLLYEMASGAKPFTAPTTPDLFSAILRDSAPLLPERRTRWHRSKCAATPAMPAPTSGRSGSCCTRW